MAKEYPLLIGHSAKGNKRLHNVKEVADFIMKHGLYSDVTVTFEDNSPLLDTYGFYLNKARTSAGISATFTTSIP